MKKRSASIALAVLALVAGCSSSDVKTARDEPEPDAGSVGADGGDAGKSLPDAGGGVRSSCDPTDKLDLLFVIDDSQSMKEEQLALAASLPSLIGMFVEGKITSPSGDRVRDLRAGRSVHFGVVTSDMGINGAPDIGKCSGFGKDGLLQAPKGCLLSEASYLEYAPEAASDELVADAACLINVGTSGCGFEQQLEAGWKALAPSSNNSFSRGTRGHGDADNAGFLREDSVLAVVYLSDEEDCSIPDTSRDLFTSTPGEMILNVKCARNLDKQHVASRYINGLKSLLPDSPEQVIFAAIVGLPIEAEGLVTGAGAPDYDAMLALPAMQYVEKEDPTLGTVLTETCSTANGVAFPGRRFLEVAKGFGANGSVRSICGDLAIALDEIANKIADRLEPLCEEK